MEPIIPLKYAKMWLIVPKAPKEIDPKYVMELLNCPQGW